MKTFPDVSKKAGMPPGSLVAVTNKQNEPITISVINYNDEQITETTVSSPEKCLEIISKPQTTTWINVDGIHDPSIVEQFGACFNLHPLTMEDILNPEGRVKIEEFDNYIYITLNMLYFNEQTNQTCGEHVSIIFTENTVISFLENPGDVFNPVRERLRSNKTKIRKLGSSFLTYALVDAIIDHYFIVLERIGEMIADLEDEMIGQPDQESLSLLHTLKRELIFIRRSVWPLREIISQWTRSDSEFINDYTRTYLRDAYDHVVQTIDMIEVYRDMLTSMLDLYLSSIANRTNEVMKVLTIIATIFIPLTFIAGVYGMNFDYMPELRWRLGYFIIWGIMVGIAIGMLFWFRKKKWL